MLIPTLEGAGGLARCVEAILLEAHAAEVRVVDQSPDHRASASLATFRDDPRLVLQAATPGLSRALNAGLAATRCDLVATTGDDCVPQPGWLDALTQPFESPRVGVTFGAVEPAVGAGEWSPRNEPGAVVHADSLPRLAAVHGTSACMAVRRTAWLACGGFDELLGVGARFGAGEDFDLTLRCVLEGFTVVESPAPRVVHGRGYRPEATGAVIRRYWGATGAALSKTVRTNPLASTLLLLGLGGNWLTNRRHVVDERGPRRSQRLTAFAAGFAAGCRVPIDRKTGLFRPGRELPSG